MRYLALGQESLLSEVCNRMFSLPFVTTRSTAFVLLVSVKIWLDDQAFLTMINLADHCNFKLQKIQGQRQSSIPSTTTSTCLFDPSI